MCCIMYPDKCMQLDVHMTPYAECLFSHKELLCSHNILYVEIYANEVCTHTTKCICYGVCGGFVD